MASDNDNELERTRARKYARGVTLHTRDGSQIGNAVIVKQLTPKGSMAAYLKDNGNQKLWLVETDFGNRMTMCDREIDTAFIIGFEGDYDRWWGDRMDAIQKGVTGE